MEDNDIMILLVVVFILCVIGGGVGVYLTLFNDAVVTPTPTEDPPTVNNGGSERECNTRRDCRTTEAMDQYIQRNNLTDEQSKCIDPNGSCNSDTWTCSFNYKREGRPCDIDKVCGDEEIPTCSETCSSITDKVPVLISKNNFDALVPGWDASEKTNFYAYIKDTILSTGLHQLTNSGSVRRKEITGGCGEAPIHDKMIAAKGYLEGEATTVSNVPALSSLNIDLCNAYYTPNGELCSEEIDTSAGGNRYTCVPGDKCHL